MAARAPTTGRVEIRHLEAFIVLAACGHFGQAATELSVSRPTLSRTIAQLEQVLDRRLVDRSQATVGLTAAGRALLPNARESVTALRRGILGARRSGSPAPVLGLLNSLGYEWLGALRQEVRARGDEQPELRQLTWPDGFEPLADLVDVGIFPLPLVLPDGLQSITLGHRRPWVALAAGHRLARLAEVPLPALHAEPAISPPAHEVWMRSVEMMFRAHDAEFALGIPAASMCEVLALIAAGRGWTMAAAKSEFHPWDGVVFRPLAEVDHVRVAAVWERRRSDEARVTRLVAALVEAIAE